MRLSTNKGRIGPFLVKKEALAERGTMASTYLVFGDLHGRILPAFRLALAWQREHDERVTALLQVGDLGFFPDPAHLDKATLRHAERDPLELGAQLVANRSREADALFAEPDLPEALWFTAGNHEDFDALAALAHGGGCTRDDFAVDYYGRVRCVRDGHVVGLQDGLRVAALWGVDDEAPNARRRLPSRAYLKRRSATGLYGTAFDVLLAHESPRDAVHPDCGSEAISELLRHARPGFAFFGHYGGAVEVADAEYGPTLVRHLAGLELRGTSGTAEARSVGVLRWEGGKGSFEYVAPEWLRTVTRYNWEHR
jgi:hypothetical protein